MKKKKALLVGLTAVLLVTAVALILWLAPFGDKKDVDDAPLYILNLKDLPRTTLTEGVTYVSEQCLYMTPLSSTLALAGDSGYTYTWSAEGLTRTYLPTGGSMLLKAKSDWEEFPWTDEEWNDMFTLGGLRDVGKIFDKMRVMELSDSKYLMDMDGSLLYASISQHPDGTSYVWDIYTLIPTEEKGSTLMHLDGEEAVSIRVEAQHKSIVVDVTGYRDVGEEEDAYVGDHWTVEAGEIVSWSPYSEEGRVNRATMHLHLQDGEKAMTAATLYFIKEGTGEYRVILVGTDRHLTVEGNTLVLH